MTIVASIIAAVTIAFPREGQRMPMISQCYAIGAADGGEERIMVNGKSVEVSWSGSWGTMLDVVPGENVIVANGTRRTFYVAAPKKGGASKTNAPAKVYPKLAYAKDVAKLHPTGAAKITVVIDAGHGGSDGGAISPHGLEEKDANLRLAKEVEFALKQKGCRVVMTRDIDAAVPLYDRPKVAHAAKADAFVSIHHNAPPFDKNPLTLRYQAVYAWNSIGEKLARAINRQMANALPDLRNNGVMHANFAVTRNPEIPSCLIEADFITAPEGEAASWDFERRKRVAAAIANGVMDWLAQKQ